MKLSFETKMNTIADNYATVSLLNKKMIAFAKRISIPLAQQKLLTWKNMSPQLGVLSRDYKTTKKLFQRGVVKRDAEYERIKKFP